MQITGVQSVGARGLSSVSVTIADPGEVARELGSAVDHDAARSAPRSLHPEAVVFPREGKPLDQRPVDLRKQRASARYRDDGKPRD